MRSLLPSGNRGGAGCPGRSHGRRCRSGCSGRDRRPAPAPQPATTAAAAPAGQPSGDDAAASNNAGASSTADASSSPAPSGKDKASACAARLSKDSKAIYDATAPHVTSLAALKDTVVTETRQLAMSGKIAQATAKSSAQAAGQCLELLAGN